MYLIYRHLLATAVGPFIFGWFVITFMLMIDVLFRYVDLFVTKGVPFILATKVLALSLGHTFALSVPMAVLIGVLMSVGQLAADHEITAMKASGISLGSVLRPLLMGAGFITLGLTAYNHYVFPESNHLLANLLYDINHKKPMLEIREQQFTEMNDQLTIYVREKDDITGRIEDVSIFEKEQPGDVAPRLTIAAWGTIRPDHRNDSMLIELHDGEIHEAQDRENPDKYQVIRFRQHNLQLENVERDFQESGRKTRGDREMNLEDLWAAASDERQNQLKVGTRVRELGDQLLVWQWKLFDPGQRDELLGTVPMPEIGAQRIKFFQDKFKATSAKVDRIAEQSRYQARILDSYRVKENRYMVEFHKKFAIPFACIVFVILGVPMAVTTSRSGKGISVSLALAVYLLYYLFLMGGEKLADRGKVDPAMAMWSANVVLLVVGIPLFLRAMKEGPLWWPRRKDKAVEAVPDPSLNPAGHGVP